MSRDKQYHARCQQFLDDRMIKINLRKSSARSSHVKTLQKVLEIHVRGNPYKVPIRQPFLSLSYNSCPLMCPPRVFNALATHDFQKHLMAA